MSGSDLQPPQSILVETCFNSFVKQIGGELVSELMPKGVDAGRNADYVFRKEAVVVELKCFQKDLFNNQDDVERILKIVKRHAAGGTVSGHTAMRWVLGQEPLPREYF